MSDRCELDDAQDYEHVAIERGEAFMRGRTV